MMFAILNVSVKWSLFDGISFNEVPMGCLVIVKSRLKTFSTTCVLLWTCFAWKKIHNTVGTTVQVIRVNATSSLGTERSKCFGSHNIFAYFAPSSSTWSARAFLLLKRCYLRCHKNTFQTFSSSVGITIGNPTIGIFSRTFPCSLSGVNSKLFQTGHF